MELIQIAAVTAAEKVAREHAERTVPGIVDNVMRFNKENAGDGDPNKVAEAYATEGPQQ